MRLPGYDAWLEEPYQQMYVDDERFERCAERYAASDEYESDLAKWLESNPDADPIDFVESDEFIDTVQTMMYEDYE